jgi:hypothetical protein
MHGCLEAKHLYQRCSKKDPGFFASLRMTIRPWQKNPDRIFRSGFFKSYPADAVQADHPFPSVTGG